MFLGPVFYLHYCFLASFSRAVQICRGDTEGGSTRKPESTENGRREYDTFPR
jgi:hypothetical protein